MATIRQPAVAGQFYPGSREQLLREIRRYTVPQKPEEKLNALGCVVPHAGYMYSGHVAGAVYARLQLPEKFVILCPNHTGAGHPLAIMSEGEWLTPLGRVRIDTDLAEEFKRQCQFLGEDINAHLGEHALEVQLPFLQALVPEFTFVPITVGTSRLNVLTNLGEALATSIAGRGRVLVIASSDMNHYESDEVTRIKDHRALDRILELDPVGLYDVVTRNDISMCGFGPAVTMLTAAKTLGAKGAQLIRYATSGDVSGDRGHVVGYAGVAVV